MALRMPDNQYVQIGQIRARYWSVGDKGPIVILIHGLGASSEIWVHNIEELAKSHRVFVLDLPGFGLSTAPSLPFSPLDYSSLVDDFMKALEIDKASLIGQSLGGGIALHYAIQLPRKVEKLVLVDCAGLGREVIWTLRLMSFPLIGKIISYPTRFTVESFFKLAVSNPEVITDEIIDIYYRFFNQPGFQAFLLKITRMLVDIHGGKREMLAPILENLHKINAPTLIVWGENDRVFPLKHAIYGRNKMADAELRVMKNCGHIPNLERPEEFNRLVLDFLIK